MDSDIFLSYCHTDRQLAEQFVRSATARGVNVWFDQQIEGGQDWRQTIVDALGSAKALVILFSEHSNASSQLIKELAVADSLRKRVIPVLISDCEPRGAYLYELASRNWINIHPNPDTRLDPLIENLMLQLDVRGVPPVAAVIAPTAVSTAREAPSSAPVLAQPPALRESEYWFPLGRHDLYVLVPILVAAFLIGLFGTGDNKLLGFALGGITACIYMLVIGVRNARLNRSVSSRQSFASYVVVLVIGVSPVLVSGGSLGENIGVFVVFIVVSVAMAVVANMFQVVLRRVFQVSLFRSKVVRPLGA